MAEPVMNFNTAADNVATATTNAYTQALEVSNCKDLGKMTGLALKAQMAMTIAKTGNDILSKAMKQSGESMEACTQSM